MLSKKHYETIAKIMKAQRTAVTVREQVRCVIIEDLSTYFKQDNPSFKRDTFLEACDYREDNLWK
jgi:hypothetical protein